MGKPKVMEGSLEALERLGDPLPHRPFFPSRSEGVPDLDGFGTPG